MSQIVAQIRESHFGPAYPTPAPCGKSLLKAPTLTKKNISALDPED